MNPRLSALETWLRGYHTQKLAADDPIVPMAARAHSELMHLPAGDYGHFTVDTPRSQREIQIKGELNFYLATHALPPALAAIVVRARGEMRFMREYIIDLIRLDPDFATHARLADTSIHLGRLTDKPAHWIDIHVWTPDGRTGEPSERFEIHTDVNAATKSWSFKPGLVHETKPLSTDPFQFNSPATLMRNSTITGPGALLADYGNYSPLAHAVEFADNEYRFSFQLKYWPSLSEFDGLLATAQRLGPLDVRKLRALVQLTHRDRIVTPIARSPLTFA